MIIFSSPEPGDWFDEAEPTDAELMAIEAEWPSIEVDLLVLDVELSAYASSHAVRVHPHRRVRRRTRRGLSKAVA